MVDVSFTVQELTRVSPSTKKRVISCPRKGKLQVKVTLQIASIQISWAAESPSDQGYK